MKVLAGDIGGTNIRLALFSAETMLGESVQESVYPSKNYTSLGGVLQEFLGECGAQPEAAAFAIAGPVIGDEVEITNLEWKARKSDALEELGDIPLEFYNDLMGIGNFIPVIDRGDLVVLNPGEAAENKTKAVLAPGTGLGEGFLVWDGSEYLVQPSEGGHASFAPQNLLESELLAYMRPRYGHVSYERVCSGMAIPDLYEFMKAQEKWEEPEWFREALANATDKTPLIVQAAFDPQYKLQLCEQVVKLLVEILASEAGNLALKVLAMGGIYLAGGIPGKILSALKDHFMTSYLNKGRFSDLLKAVPVYVVTHEQPALYGAARFAFKLGGQKI